MDRILRTVQHCFTIFYLFSGYQRSDLGAREMCGMCRISLHYQLGSVVAKRVELGGSQVRETCKTVRCATLFPSHAAANRAVLPFAFAFAYFTFHCLHCCIPMDLSLNLLPPLSLIRAAAFIQYMILSSFFGFCKVEWYDRPRMTDGNYRQLLANTTRECLF